MISIYASTITDKLISINLNVICITFARARYQAKLGTLNKTGQCGLEQKLQVNVPINWISVILQEDRMELRSPNHDVRTRASM